MGSRSRLRTENATNRVVYARAKGYAERIVNRVFRMEYGQGDVIGGRYEVVQVLGRGGFGVVYLVTARHDGGVYDSSMAREHHVFRRG